MCLCMSWIEFSLFQCYFGLFGTKESSVRKGNEYMNAMGPFPREY